MPAVLFNPKVLILKIYINVMFIQILTTKDCHFLILNKKIILYKHKSCRDSLKNYGRNMKYKENNNIIN